MNTIKNLLSSSYAKLGALFLVGLSVLGYTTTAGAAIPTALTDGIDDQVADLLLIPAVLIGVAVTVGVAFMFVRIAPKMIKWVTNRFTG